METLIKGVTIADPRSPHFGQCIDVHVADGRIAAMGKHLPVPPNARIWDEPGASLSMGWVDLQADFADPGHEQKEGLASGARAAAAGGFTHVVLNTSQYPAPDHKSAIAYLRSRTADFETHLLPMGTVSQGKRGLQLSEMRDLADAGAVAFSDDAPLERTELLRRALEYASGMGRPVITCPLDFGLNAHPMMHEGPTSTVMGVVGSPHISETMRVKRDLDILRYTGGHLHFSCISAAESVHLLRGAKAEGLNVTCSTSAHHLFFIDEDLAQFDGALKVMPPFRLASDREALCQGILDGTIDALISDHRPEDLEHHDVEFALSPYGLAAIETVFPVALAGMAHLEGGESAVIRALTEGPRRVLGMELPVLEVGAVADVTWFHLRQQADAAPVSRGVNRATYQERHTAFAGHGRALGILRG